MRTTWWRFRQHSGGGNKREVFWTILPAVLLALGTRLGGQAYQIEGRCMEPHLFTGERVLAEKWTFAVLRSPRRGDVVVFERPGGPNGALYIKRIVAVGGETVALRAGRVVVNGRLLAEPYRRRRAGGDWGPHVVAPGSLFLVGDNRDQSDDSRRFGDVPEQAVVARSVLRYWPLSRWSWTL